MYGAIFFHYKKFLEQMFGQDAWKTVLTKAGIRFKAYLATQTYSDEEFMTLLSQTSNAFNKPISSILEEFGMFIAPQLLKMYRPLIKPEWKTLDLIENVEETIHRVVRIRNPGAKPPHLQCERTSSNQVVIRYSSPRKICQFLKGIARGLSIGYQEKIEITEEKCMLKSDEFCLVIIQKE